MKSGDCLNAFVYSDGKNYSDKYCFFNNDTVTANKNSAIELTLSGAGYDADWNPVTIPVANAEISVDGKATGVKTDVNGESPSVGSQSYELSDGDKIEWHYTCNMGKDLDIDF